MATTDTHIHIQVLSDLHLEIPRPPYSACSDSRGDDEQDFQYSFPARADTLALLGDIGITSDDRLFRWLRTQLARFKLIFFLSGNHEAYHSSLEESNRRLAAFAKECDELSSNPPPGEIVGRFVLLDRTRYDLSDTVTVLGCTLWSRLDPDDLEIIRMGLKDFRMIEGFTTDIYQSLHDTDVSWLQRHIANISQKEPHRKVVVMTHHAPTVEDTSDPKFLGGPTNSAFSTELIEGPCRSEQVRVWMFGHTHWPCDFERKGVRVLSNPRGYKSSGNGFEPNMTVEILCTTVCILWL